MSTVMDRRLAPWFEHRRWRVLAELDGEVTLAGVKIAFAAGTFEIGQPGVYVTPLGARGRRGFVIIETGEDGQDIAGTEAAFGEAALRRANASWDTISGLPEEES